MLVSSISPLGGRPSKIQRFPLDQDKNGNFGIRLGYLETGEKIIIKLSDATLFANQLGETTQTFWQRIRSKF